MDPTHLADRLVAMLLLELGELRLLRGDLLGQHALQRGEGPLAAGKAAEGALHRTAASRSILWTPKRDAESMVNVTIFCASLH